MTVAGAFGDVADILASMAPSRILEMCPSKAMLDRVEELVKTPAHISATTAG